ncbi:MAG: response regulator [Nanoarchaeota archaeon]|nr:response regulator [Nanoarchaeota archaeon]MBU1632243.1 response regulator [Nanoarchaeota archaeon]MBU1876429.1 response regulator [Nanoarchaeota archaeon]
MVETLDILVVEDDPVCTASAQAVLESYKVVNVDCARDYSEATRMIEKKRYNGVLLDLYFPEETGSGLKEKARALLEEFDEDETIAYLRDEVNNEDERLQPLGFLVAEKLKQEGVYFVFVSTAAFGHGMKTNPFYSLRKYASKIGAQREFEWTKMDSNPPYRDVGINDLIARVTLASLKSRGIDFKDIRNGLKGAFANHPVYGKMTGENWNDEEVTYWSIKLGIVPPLKREKTYQGAFSALHLPFRPIPTKSF